MNKQIISFFLAFHIFSISFLVAQNVKQPSKSKKVAVLFRTQSILPIKLQYSDKELRKNTNDSTYIQSILSYKNEDNKWKDMNIEIRARGKFRRSNCYFVPVKIKIKKSNAKGTLFKGNKKLKLVLPCQRTRDKNDNVIKEYIAYKLFEVVSNYNFKTRLVSISFDEKRGKKIKNHHIKGILIEDDKNVAKRFNAKIIKRSIHPIRQNHVTCVQTALFQFMIGNIDFSIAKQHNAKLFSIDKKIFPIPYDFDMSGFVNPSYGIVSQIPGSSSQMTSITQRKYRGLKREIQFMEKVRQEFLTKQSKMENILLSFENDFENKKEFSQVKEYLTAFFEILKDDQKFKKRILDQMRSF